VVYVTWMLLSLNFVKFHTKQINCYGSCSVVILSIHITRDSVVVQLRWSGHFCGGYIQYSISLEIVSVKEFWKSINFWIISKILHRYIMSCSVYRRLPSLSHFAHLVCCNVSHSVWLYVQSKYYYHNKCQSNSVICSWLAVVNLNKVLLDYRS